MKQLVHRMAGIALFCVIGMCCAKPNLDAHRAREFEQELERARQLQKEEKFTDAISVCRKIIEEAPPGNYRAEALLRRAGLRVRLEDYAGALSDARIAERIRPSDARAHHLQGAAHAGQASYQEALTCFSRALELKPDGAKGLEAAVLVDRSWSYFQLGFFDLALADVSAAIRIDPKEPRFYRRRAAFNFERGAYDSSAKDFLQVISLEGKVSDRYRDYGLTQWFLGNHGVASNYFSKYAQFKGGAESRHSLFLGSCYAMVYDYPQAIALYDIALNTDPDCDLCYADRALAKFFQSEFDTSFEDITRAIELGKPSGSSLGLRGTLYLVHGSNETAYTDFEQAIRLSPGSEQAYIGVIASCLLSDRTNEAVIELQRSAEKRIWRSQLWLWCRLLEVETGKDYDDYVLAFSRQAWPHVLTRYYLGQVGAEEVLKCAAHPNPHVARQQLAEAHFYIGALLASKGDSDAANKEFAEAVKADTIWWPVRILAQKQLEMNWFAALPKWAAYPNSRP